MTGYHFRSCYSFKMWLERVLNWIIPFYMQLVEHVTQSDCIITYNTTFGFRISNQMFSLSESKSIQALIVLDLFSSLLIDHIHCALCLVQAVCWSWFSLHFPVPITTEFILHLYKYTHSCIVLQNHIPPTVPGLGGKCKIDCCNEA